MMAAATRRRRGERLVRIARDVPTVSCIVGFAGCAVLTGAGAVLYTSGVRPGDAAGIHCVRVSYSTGVRRGCRPGSRVADEEGSRRAC